VTGPGPTRVAAPPVVGDLLRSSHGPGRQRAPRWIRWSVPAAIAWGVVYGGVRVRWAIGPAPSFPPSGRDLIVFGGWWAVGLCAAAVGIATQLRRAPWRWPLLVAAWAVSAALLAASAPLLLDLVGALLPGVGVAFHPVAFLSRAACFGGGVLLGANAVAYRRRCRSACLTCGRSRTSGRATRPPRWAWYAAYAAVAGCLLRLLAQLTVGLDMLSGDGSLLLFEAGFLLAGTVLPLAMVHRWGRAVPGWVPLLGGRRVPRWLPLGPALAIGGMMTTYFAVTVVILTVEAMTGTFDSAEGDLPVGFFWVAVPAYLTWGIGLTVAAIGYFTITRPPCSACGR
jgi:hypothetical protein